VCMLTQQQSDELEMQEAIRIVRHLIAHRWFKEFQK